MPLPLGLALSGIALIVAAAFLQRRWNKRGALPDWWFEDELPKHEKQEKRAAGLSGL